MSYLYVYIHMYTCIHIYCDFTYTVYIYIYICKSWVPMVPVTEAVAVITITMPRYMVYLWLYCKNLLSTFRFN